MGKRGRKPKVSYEELLEALKTSPEIFDETSGELKKQSQVHVWEPVRKKLNFKIGLANLYLTVLKNIKQIRHDLGIVSENNKIVWSYPMQITLIFLRMK